jgi:hypothetical protein
MYKSRPILPGIYRYIFSAVMVISDRMGIVNDRRYVHTDMLVDVIIML